MTPELLYTLLGVSVSTALWVGDRLVSSRRDQRTRDRNLERRLSRLEGRVEQIAARLGVDAHEEAGR